MKITIISILLPYPLTSGGAQAQFNMIDTLRQDNTITFIYPENQNNNRESLKKLQRIWPDVRFETYPYYKQLLYIPFFKQKIIRLFKLVFLQKSNEFQKERILQPYGYEINKSFTKFINTKIKDSNPGIIQIEFYPYLDLIDYIHCASKKIFIHHEIRYIRNIRALEQLKINSKDMDFFQSLKNSEIEQLNKFDAVITLTDIDKNILKNDGVKTTIYVSPAAINTPVTEYRDWNNSLLFIGGKSHLPNSEGMNWLCDKVFPLLKINSTTFFKVIGAGWTKKDVRVPNAHILGFVPDLVSVASGSIMLVPILSGSGMRMKILEAAAMGLPIITTTVGKEGINLIHNESCIIADTPKEFANAMLKLESDKDLREKIAKNAQLMYITEYSKEGLATKRNDIYKQIVKL